MLDYLTNFALTGGLIVGLIVVVLTKFNLRVFQGVYILLGAVNILTSYFIFGVFNYWILLFLLLGEVFFLVLLGGLGSGLSVKNYASILFTIGLFPWYLSVSGSIIFLILTFFIILIFSHIKNVKAFKSIGEGFSNPVKALKKMSEDKKEIFVKQASVIFAKPILFSLLIFLVLSPFVN